MTDTESENDVHLFCSYVNVCESRPSPCGGLRFGDGTGTRTVAVWLWGANLWDYRGSSGTVSPQSAKTSPLPNYTSSSTPCSSDGLRLAEQRRDWTIPIYHTRSISGQLGGGDEDDNTITDMSLISLLKFFTGDGLHLCARLHSKTNVHACLRPRRASRTKTQTCSCKTSHWDILTF